MELEQRRIDPEFRERIGFSLKELLSPEIRREKGAVRPRVSERVLWLSDAMETEVFWLGLNKSLAEDDQKRQSVGGVFTRESGQAYIGPYTWGQAFSSLDNFLKQFDMRATEFLFRDFQPENASRELARFISATRDLAVDKYPRFRRIYWEGYEEVLESSSFWRALSVELESLDQPVAPNAFFGWPQKTKKGRRERKDITSTLRSVFKKQFGLARGQLGKRAKLLEYHNFAQIVRDRFNQDPRTFLLDYEPKSEVLLLQEIVDHAKQQIRLKILPTQEVPESLSKMDRKEFTEVINSEEFWLSLITDIENHANSQTQAYSLSNFLRHYNNQENNINYGRPGTYTRFTTAYLQSASTTRWRRRLIKPSQELVQRLMWEFEPNEKLKPLVIRAKDLCVEMFPEDCLYVALQTPQFWEAFTSDLQEAVGVHTLPSFLRYFSRENANCDRRRHKKGTARYQRLLHRAYHEQEEFMKLTSQLGIYVPDYKDALIELFWKFAPDEVKQIMEQKLSKDYNPEIRSSKSKHAQLLDEAKDYIRALTASEDKKGSLKFRSKKQAKEFRDKLWSASRSLKTNIMSRLKGATLNVEIGNRFTFSKKDRPEFETQVKKLRRKGLSNEAIAQRLGVKDHQVEYAAGKLARKGVIFSRR